MWRPSDLVDPDQSDVARYSTVTHHMSAEGVRKHNTKLFWQRTPHVLQHEQFASFNVAQGIAMFGDLKHVLGNRKHKSSYSLFNKVFHEDLTDDAKRRSSIDLAGISTVIRSRGKMTTANEERLPVHAVMQASQAKHIGSSSARRCPPEELHEEGQIFLQEAEQQLQAPYEERQDSGEERLSKIGTSSTVSGSDHAGRLMRSNSIAIQWRVRGRYQAAEESIRTALDMVKASSERDDALILMSENNLAVILQDQAKSDEAEVLFRGVLEIRKSVLGLEHHLTLISLNNLATLLRDKGAYDEAESLIQLSLKVGKDVLGQEHEDMFTFANNLGVVLRQQKRLQEAEPVLRRVVEDRELWLGGSHADTLTSISNLAMVLCERDKHRDAEALFHVVLAGRERQFGEKHPRTCVSVWWLAHLARLSGRKVEAEILYRRALSSFTTSLGETHPHTVSCRSQLADMVRKT
jgi:tetratricopeptide (TPR) repeat protein